jgi:protoporphyrinogen oxidase
MHNKVVVIGAGPAGLTAAYELTKAGVATCVLEQDDIVGGLSRTVSYKNYHFDIGGHRFYTKVAQVKQMWMEVLGDDFLVRDRLSRIYFNKHYFHYPLRPANALFGLGIWNSMLIVLSYLHAQCLLFKEDNNLEDWISHRFGNRLYQIFFKTYTEKVWGVPCTDIKAEWAAQRIKGLSLVSAIVNAFRRNSNANGTDVIKTLIEQFHYPKYGPGMMWQAAADIVLKSGGEVCLGSKVAGIIWSNNRIDALEVKRDGCLNVVEGTDFISSMPIRDAIRIFRPAVPEHVLDAANSLRYRDFITVALIIKKEDLFPDNWIYIHDPQVKVGRIQNYNNWSPYMVGEPHTTCLGLEYFCFVDDDLWKRSDAELMELAREEIHALGLANRADVVDGAVVRMPKSYPMYDEGYSDSLDVIKQFINGIANLQLIGRNGMHRYNNQDHSMLTGMLAVKNIFGEKHDLWSVNVDKEYLEEDKAEKAEAAGVEQLLTKAFSRIDKLALATAVGTVSGLMVFLATVLLVITGGYVVGPNLQLLEQYFYGYRVTLSGAVIGFGYTFVWGFLFGWTFAYLRNLMIGYYVYRLTKRLRTLEFKHFINSIL